jgi:ATP-dependent DNA ligase
MLHVFDLLHLDGRSTRALSYRERRALLVELALDGPCVAYASEHRRRGCTRLRGPR